MLLVGRCNDFVLRWAPCTPSRLVAGLTVPQSRVIIGRRYFALHESARRCPETVVSLRKDLKDELKRKKVTKGSGNTIVGDQLDFDKWELTVGIEIHAELNTARKLFSRATTSESKDDTPNSHVARFDLSLPGSQPHFQQATLIPAVRAALALDCSIQRRSLFDRKHYFYQDQPAGYQITQYYAPFAKDGQLTLYKHDGIAPEDGDSITVGIKQIQMEQDTAKTLQQPPDGSLLDFNRVSHPLIEIITLPHIHHPQTAAAYVRKVQQILKSIDAATTGMELGGLRADVNVSVKRKGEELGEVGRSYSGVTGLGQRTEIKNLSSFKSVEDAIVAERNRQIRLIEAGGKVEGETRGWTLGSTETRKLRGKEGEVDYRYMPDPDLPPVVISQKLIAQLQQTLPALPDAMLDRLADPASFRLTVKDAKTLLSFGEGERVEYFLDVVHRLGGEANAARSPAAAGELGRQAGNWVLHELGGLFAKAVIPWSDDRVSSTTLATIVARLSAKKITYTAAKSILSSKFEGDERDVDTIINEENMTVREVPDSIYEDVAQQILAEHEDVVKDVREKGKTGKAMFLLGKMMRKMTETGGEGGVQADKARAVLFSTLGIDDVATNAMKKKSGKA